MTIKTFSEFVSIVFALGQANARMKGDERQRNVNTLAVMQPPVPMVLHCPQCATPHVDQDERPQGGDDWTTRPHKSHLCAECKTVWRPADIYTVGVAAIGTRGKDDTWPMKLPLTIVSAADGPKQVRDPNLHKTVQEHFKKE